MKLIASLLSRLTLRRLQLRARQMSNLLRDPEITVYPLPLDIEKEKSRRVLVLTPHADDETFGMAGILHGHVRAGHDVLVVLVSDNVESLPHSSFTDEAIRDLREEEFLRAMDALGVTRSQCLRMDHDALQQETAIREALRSVFVENQPHVLYLPSLFDNHHEHRKIHRLAAEAVRMSKIPLEWCRGYEVWHPLPATHVYNISDTIQEKVRAIHCYPSQLAVLDYEHHILGLNAYRALTAGGEWRYAEAVLQHTLKSWLSSVDRVFLSSHTSNT